MNFEDIIRYAKDAGWDTVEDMPLAFGLRLQKFARMIEQNAVNQKEVRWYEMGYADGRKVERERCAKIALTGTGEPVQTKTLKILKNERNRIYAEILEVQIGEGKLVDTNVRTQ